MSMIWTMRIANEEQRQTLFDNPAQVVAFVTSIDAYKVGQAIDCDKEWHAVHYLLSKIPSNGDSDLKIIIGDFENVGEDTGYGPPWYIPAEKLKSFHAKISEISDDYIADFYDTSAMMADYVYIADILHKEGEEGKNFIMENVKKLRKFVSMAAESNSCAFALIC